MSNRPSLSSIRLKNFDYAGNATYFVTICSFARRCLFAEVEDGLVVANDLGDMVQREWLRSAIVRPELDLHSFVLMPNHLHALLTIVPAESRSDAEVVGGSASGVRDTPLRIQARSLGSTIGGFKGRTTSLYRAITSQTDVSLWQRGYHEHVVRNEADFARIAEYIANNPFNWHKDVENSEADS
jgi:REP element-mobilizing transposase RayT